MVEENLRVNSKYQHSSLFEDEEAYLLDLNTFPLNHTVKQG